jgi:hypothetical protein
MKRSWLLTALAIVAAGGLTVAQLAAVRPSPTIPRVDGAGVQNGWVMDGAFDGTQSSILPAAPRGNDAFITFLHRVLPFLADDKDDCVAHTPAFIGLRLRVPDTAGGFTFTGRMPDGRTFTMTSAETRAWIGRGYREEEYLALPPIPENCPWIEITVNDTQQVPIIWRVSNLPKLVHHNFGPAMTDTLKLADGGVITGRAWLGAASERFSGEGQFVGVDRVPVHVQLLLRNHPTVSTADLRWDTNNPMLTEEWDVPSSAKKYYPESFTAQRLCNSDFSTDTEFQGGAAIFPEMQHAVQVKGTAEEHLSLHETVTFHNVLVERRSDGWYLSPAATGSTVRSANGVTVSLLPIEVDGYHGLVPQPVWSNAIRFRFGVAMSDGSGHQPGTALYGRRHGPIVITDRAVSLVSGTGRSFNRVDMNRDSYLMPNYYVGMVSPSAITRPLPHVDISIELQEDTVVRTVPYSLTLPVQQVIQLDRGSGVTRIMIMHDSGFITH